MMYRNFEYSQIDSVIRIDNYNGSDFSVIVPLNFEGLPVIEMISRELIKLECVLKLNPSNASRKNKFSGSKLG